MSGTNGKHIVRIGIIGCGHVAERHHLPTLAGLGDLAQVVALSDLDAARLAKLGHAFGVERRYDDFRKLLDDKQVDAVAVLVPPQHHVKVACAAFDAGKHVFIEKPLADTLAGTDGLVERSRTSGVKSTIGFMLRSHRHVREARRLIQSGALGQIEMIRTVWTGGPAHRLTLPQWLDVRSVGGGVLIESGVHHYDMWRHLLGEEIVEIQAASRSVPTQDACAVVSGRTTSGILTTSVFSKGTSDSHEIDVFGDAGRLRVSAYRVDGLEVYSLHDLTGGMKQRLRRMANQARKFPEAYAISKRGGVFTEAYANEWRSFLNAILHNETPVVSLEDGRRAQALGVAAAKSVDLNRPVRIDANYSVLEVNVHDAPQPPRRPQGTARQAVATPD